MHIFIHDIRYGVRMLLKNPGMSLIAIITLALGIGANSAIFNVVNSILLKPLPFKESHRLVRVVEFRENFGGMSIAYPNFEDWRNQNRVFEKIGVWVENSYTLTEAGEPEQMRVVEMSADMFDVLRVKAFVGRVFTNEEDKPGANPVVVLGHGIWQRRFGGNTSIIGRSITLNDRRYTVIGVMPEGFQFPERFEMWTPVGQLAALDSWKSRGNHPGLLGVARLKPGVTLEQAHEDMKRITTSLEKLYPQTNDGNSAKVQPLLETYVRDIRQTLYLLLGVVGGVLLIACANVANLTLSRALGRRKEIVMRIALGASRRRLIRQLVTESFILALIGGGLGLLVAQWGVSTITSIAPEAVIPRITEIKFDNNVLLFTLTVSVLTVVGFGLVPAFQSSRPDIQDVLRETSSSNTGHRHSFRNVIVVIQVALTLILLIGAGLMIRSFLRLQYVSPGFATENVLSFRINLSDKKYLDTEPDRWINFFNQVKEKIKAQPGVQSVGMSSGLPLGNNGWSSGFTIVGRPDPPREQVPMMDVTIADIGYLKTLRLPLLRGRWFNEQDNRSHLRPDDLKNLPTDRQLGRGLQSIVIDEEFARRYWPGENPLGKQVRLGRSDEPNILTLTVIGVVGRVNMDGIRENSDRVQAYYSSLQYPYRWVAVTVRSTMNPEQLAASVRSQIQSIDPNQPIYDIRTLEQIRSQSIAPDRLNLMLLGIFAGISLILAMIGIYGVLSWSVTQRIREIGLRMVLGASMRNVLTLVIGGGMKLIGIGIALGLIGAFLLTRVMKSLLYEVSATDPITFILITILLVVTAILACWIPARRATKVDPISVLRQE